MVDPGDPGHNGGCSCSSLQLSSGPWAAATSAEIMGAAPPELLE